MTFKMVVLGLALGLGLGVSAATESVFVGYWVNAPERSSRTAVDGISLGVPLVSAYSVDGAELSLLGGASDRMSGLQFSFFGANATQYLKGVQLGLVNWVSKMVDGVGIQLGFLNHTERGGIQLGAINQSDDNARFQLGMININTNGWLPIMIIVNFGRDTFR